MIEQPEADDVKATPLCLRRSAAAFYLRDTWGIYPSDKGSLVKLAKIGGGPKFWGFCGVPIYFTVDLDLWALSVLPPPSPDDER
jgi:hypothetical protein